MEELQARIRAIRTLQTEMNLAKQPDLEPDSAGGREIQEGPKVVEMRERSQTLGEVAESGAVQRSSRKKGQSASKRKSPASTTKPKSMASFQQLREGNSQPYADELKRLEAQAERINQLLAERAEKKAQFEQRRESIADQAQPAKAGRVDGSPLKGMAPTRSKKSASKNPQQTQQSFGGREVPPMSEFNEEEAEVLKAQADRINQLLAELEATIRQGGAIVDPQRVQSPVEVSPTPVPLDLDTLSSEWTEYFEPSSEPQIPNPRDRNLKQRVQEAAETAQALRHLANRERVAESKGRYETRARPRSSQAAANPLSRIGLRLRQFLQVPRKPMDRVGDAVLWIVLSAVVRIGLRFLLMMYPVLSPVVMGLIFVPPALAVYLAVFVPRAGFVSVYRLFLITLGLLLGGKF